MDPYSWKELTCPFFTYGKCNFNESSCVFSHDPQSSKKVPDDACFFFLRGNCIKGNACPKRHLTVKEITGSNEIDEMSKLNVLDVNVESPNETSPIEPTKSYAFAASLASSSKQNDPEELAKREICTFFEANGICLLEACTNVHGELCDLCGFYSLHPYSELVREKHRKECIEEHEKQMEASFAYQRSKELTCGICLDVVMEKESRTSCRFGLLENCAHIYCIECIRTWRKSNFDKKNKRGCPQCRIKSDFIIPSEYFYEEGEEKKKIIDTYKNALSDKHCKYFKKGAGKCPFEGACFYKHEYPDGRKADLPMPSERKRGISSTEQAFSVALGSLLLDLDALSGFISDDDDFHWLD